MQPQEGAREFHLSQDHTSRENCKNARCKNAVFCGLHALELLETQEVEHLGARNQNKLPF